MPPGPPRELPPWRLRAQSLPDRRKKILHAPGKGHSDSNSLAILIRPAELENRERNCAVRSLTWLTTLLKNIERNDPNKIRVSVRKNFYQLLSAQISQRSDPADRFCGTRNDPNEIRISVRKNVHRAMVRREERFWSGWRDCWSLFVPLFITALQFQWRSIWRRPAPQS